jgi:hypothetical protein
VAILMIEYQVPDFGAWKEIFDNDPMGRGPHASPATGSTRSPTTPTTSC